MEKRSFTVPEQFAFYDLISRLNLRRAARTAVEASKREEFQPQRTYLMCMPFSLLEPCGSSHITPRSENRRERGKEEWKNC